MADPVQKKENKEVIRLLLQNEMIEVLGINKSKMKSLLEDGMPYYLIGTEKRFLEKETKEWLKVYMPSQKRLEQEFRDRRGRTIEAYVTDDIIQNTIRVSKSTLNKQCAEGMPYVTVGAKRFYNIDDILIYFRVGMPIEKGKKESKPKVATEPKQKAIKEPKIIIKKDSSSSPNQKNEVMKLLGNNVPKNYPLFIVDGSYNFNNYNVGTGVILLNHHSTTTGLTFVRKIKTKHALICEYLAIIEALKMVKSEKMEKAIIYTDQEKLVTGIDDINVSKLMKDSSISEYINELRKLFIELKEKVELRYVGKLKHGKKNPIFKKAHTLSRVYKNNIITEIEI